MLIPMATVAAIYFRKFVHHPTSLTLEGCGGPAGMSTTPHPDADPSRRVKDNSYSTRRAYDGAADTLTSESIPDGHQGRPVMITPWGPADG